MRQKQLHKLRRVITEIMNYIPKQMQQETAIRQLAGYGYRTQMHVVSLQAPMLECDDHLKDINFSGPSTRPAGTTTVNMQAGPSN